MEGGKESLTLNGRTIKTQTPISNSKSLKDEGKIGRIIKVISTHNPRKIMDKPMKTQIINDKIGKKNTLKVKSKHNPQEIVDKEEREGKDTEIAEEMYGQIKYSNVSHKKSF